MQTTVKIKREHVHLLIKWIFINGRGWDMQPPKYEGDYAKCTVIHPTIEGRQATKDMVALYGGTK